MDEQWIELRCAACGYRESIPFEALVEQIRRVGHLRKTAQPSRELVLELARTTPPPFACPRCGAHSPARMPGETGEPEEQWELTRRCQSCRRDIDPDRLEIFPSTTLCTACQAKSESGDNAEYGFCERCGGRLTMAGRSGSGLAGYQLKCSDCGSRQ